MKSATLLAAAILAAPPAAFATMDLSRPGALDRLRAHKPSHYEAVAEVAQLGEKLTCDASDLDTIKPRFPVANLDCGIVSMNNGVSQRRIKFEVDGEAYSLTVRIRDTAPRLIGR